MLLRELELFGKGKGRKLQGEDLKSSGLLEPFGRETLLESHHHLPLHNMVRPRVFMDLAVNNEPYGR